MIATKRIGDRFVARNQPVDNRRLVRADVRPTRQEGTLTNAITALTGALRGASRFACPGSGDCLRPVTRTMITGLDHRRVHPIRDSSIAAASPEHWTDQNQEDLNDWKNTRPHPNIVGIEPQKIKPNRFFGS